MRTLRILCFTSTIFGLASSAHAVPAYLLNGNFMTPAAGTRAGDPMITGPFDVPGGWYSASANWSTWANVPHTEHVSWITTAPDGTPANLMSAGGSGGFVQVLADGAGAMIPQGTPTNVNRVTIVVNVLVGQIGLQLGDGGNGGGPGALSSGTRGWQKLSTCGRPDALNSEVTIYAGSAPAVFYISGASVSYDLSCGKAVK